MSRVIVRAPNRIDLGGGTLDIAPLWQVLPGSLTVNLAIGIETEVEIEESFGPYRLRSDDLDRVLEMQDLSDELADPALRLVVEALRALPPDGPVKVRTESRAPKGSGLGASSALSIALLAGLAHLGRRPRTLEQLVRLATDVEVRVLGVPTGTQDHWAAALGGALAIHFDPGGTRVERLPLPAALVEELEASVMISYTGAPRESGSTNWGVVRAAIDGKKRTVSALQAIREISHRMRQALLDGDVPEIGRLVGKDAAERKKLTPGVVPPEIARVMTEAKRAGALGSRLTGAGGGGCIITFVDPARRDPVKQTLTAGGFLPLRWSVATTGLRIS